MHKEKPAVYNSSVIKKREWMFPSHYLHMRYTEGMYNLISLS